MSRPCGGKRAAFAHEGAELRQGETSDRRSPGASGFKLKANVAPRLKTKLLNTDFGLNSHRGACLKVKHG